MAIIVIVPLSTPAVTAVLRSPLLVSECREARDHHALGMDGLTYAHMSQQIDSGEDDDRYGETEMFIMQGVSTHDDGRLTIPHRFRDMYDLDEDSIMDIIFDGDDFSFWALDVRLDASHRIRIPTTKRKLYGVEDNEPMDVEVHVTGLSL
jgi:DNA-binding transcriptional regulator/RsmH inhibitor MraZ